MRQIVERLTAAAAISLASLLWASVAPAQSPAAPPAESASGPAAHLSAAEIVTRLLEKDEQRLNALEHYESERTYRIEYKGTGGEHNAEIKVRAEYTGPNHKKFTVESESGSKFICDKVLRRLIESEQEATSPSSRMQTSLSPENYDSELLGEEMVAVSGDQIRAWVLRVKPKVNSKFTYRGKVWVSADDYAIVRIQGEPAKNPSWWINRTSFEAEYVRRGSVWLPTKNVSSSHMRLGGEATLTIAYGAYPVVVERALKQTGDSADTTSSIAKLER